MGINSNGQICSTFMNIMSVDKIGHFSFDNERSENLKKRVKSTEGIFIDEDGNLNAQNKRIKNKTNETMD